MGMLVGRRSLRVNMLSATMPDVEVDIRDSGGREMLLGGRSKSKERRARQLMGRMQRWWSGRISFSRSSLSRSLLR